MTRSRWLAVLALGLLPLPCDAQVMGGLGGGGAFQDSEPPPEWKVKVEMAGGQSVTGNTTEVRIKVSCDLGLYEIDFDKIKAIRLSEQKDKPITVGKEGAQGSGEVETASGEKISGRLTFPSDWSIRTELGSLILNVVNIRAINLLGRSDLNPTEPCPVPAEAPAIEKEVAQPKGQGPATPGPAPMPSPHVVWEYKTFIGDRNESDDEELNKLGREGWELVTISHAPGDNNVGSGDRRYVFKRPKEK